MQLYKKEQLIYFSKVSGIAGIISIFLSILAHTIVDFDFLISEVTLTSIKLFLSILPLTFLKQKNFLFKDGPLKATCLILYYLLLVPLVSFSLNLSDDNGGLELFFNLLSFLNVILLIVSHIILLKYVVTDFLSRRRKVSPKDISIVITTYITIAISFGLLYTVLSLLSPTPAFNGISYELSDFKFYFRHIYFSFITITTIGYGDIYPLTSLGEFLVMIEVITGIILTNVIMGLVIGSGIFSSKNNF